MKNIFSIPSLLVTPTDAKYNAAEAGRCGETEADFLRARIESGCASMAAWRQALVDALVGREVVITGEAFVGWRGAVSKILGVYPDRDGVRVTIEGVDRKTFGILPSRQSQCYTFKLGVDCELLAEDDVPQS